MLRKVDVRKIKLKMYASGLENTWAQSLNKKLAFNRKRVFGMFQPS